MESNVVVGGCNKSAVILHKSLSRALKAFQIDTCHQRTTEDGLELFSASCIDDTLKQFLPSLFKAFNEHNIGCAPLVLCCCILAFLWLIDEQVNQAKAMELLLLMQSHLKHLADSTTCNFTEEASEGSCPVYLFSLEYVPCIDNSIVTSSTGDLTDKAYLLSVVTSLLAFSYFANKDNEKVLETLNDTAEDQDCAFNDLYLKGYVLYLRNEVDRAVKFFQRCALMSLSQQKAASLIMLGCCCAIKGKPHTAVAKFREAMQENFQQLEALFNICLQYRKLGNFVAEIQCLKLLKQAIQSNKDADACYNVAVIPSDTSDVLDNSKLELTVPPRFTLARGMPSTRVTAELVTYMLAKRSAELGRFDEAAKSFLELLADVVDMRSSASSSRSINLPNPSELYRQCGTTLLKAERYQDTVTVCDKLLTTADSIKAEGQVDRGKQCVNSRSSKKRRRSVEEDDLTNVTDEKREKTVIFEMLMLKSEALIHLQKPLEALQSLNRVLKTLEDVQSSSYSSSLDGVEEIGEQQPKRRRIDSDDIMTMTQNQSFKPNKLSKIKARAYNMTAEILEGLGQTQDALQQLHLSLECLADNPETVYKHTQLLLKLGSTKEAVTNWLLFRGIQRYHKGDVDSIRRRLRSSIVELLDTEDVTLEQVQAVDEVVVELCSKTPDIPFYFVTN